MATGNSRRRRSASAQARDAIEQLVADEVAAKVRESLDRLPKSTHDALDLWTRTGPGARQPRFTREQIAAAAVRIADAEGIAALSMRRLAIELGAGTMTLYHYVRTKDELLAIVTDTVMAEVVVPPERLTGDWRASITAIAHASRDALVRHPWVFDIVDDPAVGPNGVRHFDQSLQAVASLPGPFTDKLDVIFAVDEYVFGHCLHLRDQQAGGDTGGDGGPMMRYVAELAATGDYPQIRALIAERGIGPVWADVTAHSLDPGRFDRNLSRLLDGIERDIGG